MKHILGVSGSLRAASYNTALLRAASEIGEPDLKVEIYDGLGRLPLFNVELEENGFPAPVADLRTAMAGADGLLVATPEYNWSITGVLKNAIDWASRGPDSPLSHKPAAILGAGGRFGTLRAQLHLREILGHNDVRLVSRPQLLLDAPAQRFDAELRLTDDRFRDQLGRLLDSLAALID